MHNKSHEFRIQGLLMKFTNLDTNNIETLETSVIEYSLQCAYVHYKVINQKYKESKYVDKIHYNRQKTVYLLLNIN